MQKFTFEMFLFFCKDFNDELGTNDQELVRKMRLERQVNRHEHNQMEHKQLVQEQQQLEHKHLVLRTLEQHKLEQLQQPLLAC